MRIVEQNRLALPRRYSSILLFMCARGLQKGSVQQMHLLVYMDNGTHLCTTRTKPLGPRFCCGQCMGCIYSTT